MAWVLSCDFCFAALGDGYAYVYSREDVIEQAERHGLDPFVVREELWKSKHKSLESLSANLELVGAPPPRRICPCV